MAKVKVVAGDIPAAEYTVSVNAQKGVMALVRTWHPTLIVKVASVEQLTVEKVKGLAGTTGWGLAGATLLGPLGAIGGMLLGGNKTEISFLCTTQEGQSFMGITDGKVYQQIVAASMYKL